MKRTKEAIATQDEVKAHRAHPRVGIFTSLSVPDEMQLWRSRCAACGETAFGSTAEKARAALFADAPCVPVELAWNNRMYGHVEPVTAR